MIQFNPQDIGVERIMRIVALKRARIAGQAPTLEGAQKIRQPADMPVLRVRGVTDDNVDVIIGHNLGVTFPRLYEIINNTGFMYQDGPQDNFLGFSLLARRTSPNICARIILIAELLLAHSIQP